MYKHKIERADFDRHAKELLDEYLNNEWVLLSHTVYASERSKDFTRSSSKYQHVLVFQKFIYTEEDNTVSDASELLKSLDKVAVEHVFGPRIEEVKKEI